MQSFKQIRGKQILISENLKDLGTHLQEEVGQRLRMSAWILPHFPSEYGTFLTLIKVESIYQHYALILIILIIWTSAETSIHFFFFLIYLFS